MNILTVYVGENSKKNLEYGLNNGIWGFKEKVSKEICEKNLEDAYLILACGFTGGSPRKNESEWNKYGLDKIYICKILKGIYKDTNVEWEDEREVAEEDRYSNRLKFAKIFEMDNILLKDIPYEISEALRMSGINQSRGNYIENVKWDILKKMQHQKILYGAPGTGKSYILKKESEKFGTIIEKETIYVDEDENLDRRYWAVGAFWDDINKKDEFIKNGYWENGYQDKYKDKVRDMKVGDLIAIKSSFCKKVDGEYRSCVRIKALGVITGKVSDTKVNVDWKIKDIKEDYIGISMRQTVHEVNENNLEIFDKLLKKEDSENEISAVDRVIFYDGYTYGQFVGCYKPVPNNKVEDNITYKYVPGPLIKSLVKALKYPNNEILLIIEEINRAKADRVFGNIFQLLDRDENGNSEYPISISDDLKKYLKTQFSEEEYNTIFKNGLFFPKNLYIWATMNSSDQGVYSLDTAFKRRWNFEYIGLNENEENFGVKEKEYLIQLEKKNEKEKEYDFISWKDYRKIINEKLIDAGIVEDRLLAPFFIKESDFDEEDMNNKNSFWLNMSIYKSKVLMYLFEDVLRHKRKNIIFKEDIKTFSELIRRVDKGENVYNEEIRFLPLEKE